MSFKQVKRVKRGELLKQVNVEIANGRMLTQYFKGFFNANEERSAGNKARPGIIVRVLIMRVNARKGGALKLKQVGIDN